MTETSTKIRARFPAYFNMDYQGCDYADIDDLEEMLTDVERLTAIVKEHNLSEVRIWGGAEFEDQDGMTRFDCCELVAGPYTVHFQDHPKHGEGFAETRGITLDALRQIVEYCKANNVTEANLDTSTFHSEGYMGWLANPNTRIPSDEDEDELDLDESGQPAPSM
jgi:hypothetical protein